MKNKFLKNLIEVFCLQKTTSNKPLEYCNIRQLTSNFKQSAQIQQRQQTIDAYNKVCK